MFTFPPGCPFSRVFQISPDDTLKISKASGAQIGRGHKQNGGDEQNKMAEWVALMGKGCDL